MWNMNSILQKIVLLGKYSKMHIIIDHVPHELSSHAHVDKPLAFLLLYSWTSCWNLSTMIKYGKQVCT